MCLDFGLFFFGLNTALNAPVAEIFSPSYLRYSVLLQKSTVLNLVPTGLYTTILKPYSRLRAHARNARAIGLCGTCGAVHFGRLPADFIGFGYQRARCRQRTRPQYLHFFFRKQGGYIIMGPACVLCRPT
eukprot:COSAG06_NODE_25868_length_627_cov_0.767045_1_plen_129_part_10